MMQTIERTARVHGSAPGFALLPAARHLALACRVLALRAETDASESDLERYRAAEARFRALADASPAYVARALAASPRVTLNGKDNVYLAELLDAVGGWSLRTSRSIDPEMVDGACDLLQGFAWSIRPRRRRQG